MRVFMLGAFLLVLLALGGCKKGPEDLEAKDLVGTWKTKDGKFTIILRPDGYFCHPDRWPVKCDETMLKMNDQWWKVQEGFILWRNPEDVLPTAHLTFKILAFTPDSFTIGPPSGSGKQVTFERQ